MKELTDRDSLTPILFGAAAFQYMNSACELGLFDLLNQKLSGLTKKDIASTIKLEQRAIDVLLLGTTALKLTKKANELYFNCHAITQLFKDNMWETFKDIVAFEQYIVYKGQFDFTESLKTNSNAGLHNIPGTGRDLYYRLSENPNLEKIFYKYMNSWTRMSNPLLFKFINFNNFSKVLDVGGGAGVNAIDIASKFNNVKITILEIPGTALIAEKNIKEAGLSDRVSILSSNMFEDNFPRDYDCLLFSHQLGIWTEEENIFILKKAYQALPEQGKVIIFSSISNDNGDGPLMAALDSVYFAAIPSEGGMVYSWNHHEDWLKKAGFTNIKRYKDSSWTPHGIIEATK